MAARQDWRAQAAASFDLVWSTVNDTFYDPTFGGVDWPGVRAELRPRVENATDLDTVRATIREMLARLHQSHFTLISAPSPRDAWPGLAMVPIDVRALDEGVVVTRVEPGSSAAAAGIRPGDVVNAIDGTTFERSQMAGSTGRQERLELWQHVFRSLHGASGSAARLSVRSPGALTRDVVVPRVVVPGEVVALGNLPPLIVRTESSELRTPAGRRVGLIGFSAWMSTVAEPFASAIDRFRQADGLVIDLRGNPGGLAEMMRGLAGHVLATPALLGRMQMRGIELEFRANPRRSTSDGHRVEPFAGPLALLVDEMTASASECFAGGLQSLGRARVFGTTTAGQALPASTKTLPSGDVLLYAVGDFVTSTGVRLEGTGVVPDVPVQVSATLLAKDPDPVLTAALAWVDRGR